MSKVFVLGAGHGGLTIAARLKVKGHDVTVIDRSNKPETVATQLTLPAAYRDFFLKTGTALEDNLELSEVTCALKLSVDSKNICIPGSGIGRALSVIADEFGNDSAQQWRNFLQEVGQLWQGVRTTHFESDSYEALKQIFGIKTAFKLRSYKRMISRNLKDPRLLALCASYRDLTSVSDESDLSLIALNSYVQPLFGVYEVSGGLSELTSQLLKRCDQLSVNFEFNSEVTPVFKNEKVAGIEDNSGKYRPAEIVVQNDFSSTLVSASWHNLPKYRQPSFGFYKIPEVSWLGLGPAHAVLGAQIVADQIGTATP